MRSFQPGVITMADHQGRPVLALLLETLVASALIGTFFIYGYAGTSSAPRVDAGEIAKLTTSR
jgi:hypothetical protein